MVNASWQEQRRFTGFTSTHRESAMKRTFLLFLASITAVVGLAGCTTMTPQQEQAAETRRFCERNPTAVERCQGFLGDM